jgi:RNA polymerase sigma factor (TIGR02999 family)
MDRAPGEVTLLLREITEGNQHALDRLMPLIYGELHRLAARCMRQERADHTLQPTALIHEAYLKLVGRRTVKWESRAHFFAAAAQLMRRILMDHAKHHLRAKRGGAPQKISLDEVYLFSEDKSAGLVALDASLARLAITDPRQSRIVELRYFGGLTIEETATVLDISPKTVKRDWSVAKAWLYGDLKACHEPTSGKMGRSQGAV